MEETKTSFSVGKVLTEHIGNYHVEVSNYVGQQFRIRLNCPLMRHLLPGTLEKVHWMLLFNVIILKRFPMHSPWNRIVNDNCPSDLILTKTSGDF